MPPNLDLDPEVQNSTVYWFFVLQSARDACDYTAAAVADRELRRLGVTVKHRRRPQRKGACDGSD